MEPKHGLRPALRLISRQVRRSAVPCITHHARLRHSAVDISHLRRAHQTTWHSLRERSLQGSRGKANQKLPACMHSVLAKRRNCGNGTIYISHWLHSQANLVVCF